MSLGVERRRIIRMHDSRKKYSEEEIRSALLDDLTCEFKYIRLNLRRTKHRHLWTLADLLQIYSWRCLVLCAYAVRMLDELIKPPGFPHKWALKPTIDMFREEIYQDD